MGILPLSGVRVVDMTRVVAGPWATRVLATFGAEVIKIESTKRLDFQRNRGPFPPGLGPPDGSAAFTANNLNKRSFTLDLTREEGRKLFLELVRKSDVVLENFSYGVMEKLGFGYDALSKNNPGVIMLSLSALGRTGPEKTAVGYGHGFHAFSGITYLTGYPDKGPGGIGGSWSDPVAGTSMTFSIMAALHHRKKTGQGQHIDLSIIEATMVGLPEALMDYTMNGRNRGRRANEDDIMAPHNTYRCAGADAWIAIGVEDDTQWRALCGVMGRPDLAADARFADRYARWTRRAELDTLVEGWTRTQSNTDLERRLQGVGVPASAVRDIRDLLEDEHLNARGVFARVPHPQQGPLLYLTTPWHLSEAKPEYRTGSLLAQDNMDILTNVLGYSVEEARRLIESGVAV
ncbi:MAG: CoA transferase [Dehalococcoidia bacterium]|nr:CoA transferase [Dehalococcoidia bacterium]